MGTSDTEDDWDGGKKGGLTSDWLDEVESDSWYVNQCAQYSKRALGFD